MAKQEPMPAADSALLPTVHEPGTFEWCEEVVECMNLAWRTRETAEQGFVAAVRAALRYRIWEILAPPFPEEPYGSLEGLIRRKADPGQAENMQIAIRFSGVLDEAAARAAPVDGRSAAPQAVRMTAAPERPGAPGVQPWVEPERLLTEEEEIVLGNRLLDQYAAGEGFDPAALAGMQAAGPEYVPASPEPAAGAPARRSPAQRKRDLLERTHPELAEAVQSGELTLKQAYVQAGIEKAVPVIDKMQRLWKAASEEERQRFMNWLAEEEDRQRKREYEEDLYGADA